MFKVCRWDGEYRKCSDIINTILTDEGYCCAFNKLPVNYSLRNYEEFANVYPTRIIDWNPEDGYPKRTPRDVYPFRSFAPGQNLGLSVVLDANLNEYYCTTTSSIGFKALLSTPIESPKMADIGMLISPGEEIRVAIDVDIEDATTGVAGIHYSKRQCFFARERKLRFYRIYTERNCRLECEANFTLMRCGCAPYFLPRDQSTKVCGQKTESCAEESKYIIERYSIERLKCNCLPACYEINYMAVLTTVGKIKKKYDTVEEKFKGNVTAEYFAENMAVVHFYFSIDKFQKKTKSEMYGFPEFLSNTGGLLGLFLGFSFLSAVEVIYFLCLSNVCRYVTRRYSDKHKPRSEVVVYPYVN
ncbi:pickpocket protein 28-like [Atheta coriaria]|uniref:pickpocket protein 28-like n=1 Tax=Dalotia coriaria TaxID=877792 RepID=UPI0031F41319